jgi:hypothetical protein
MHEQDEGETPRLFQTRLGAKREALGEKDRHGLHVCGEE